MLEIHNVKEIKMKIKILVIFLSVISIKGMEESGSKYASLYDILGVSWKATLGEIKKAHKTLSCIYHPDNHENSLIKAKISQQDAEDHLKIINTAYEILGNYRIRKIYDTFNLGYPHYYLKTEDQIQRSIEESIYQLNYLMSNNEPCSKIEIYHSQLCNKWYPIIYNWNGTNIERMLKNAIVETTYSIIIYLNANAEQRDRQKIKKYINYALGFINEDHSLFEKLSNLEKEDRSVEVRSNEKNSMQSNVLLSSNIFDYINISKESHEPLFTFPMISEDIPVRTNTEENIKQELVGYINALDLFIVENPSMLALEDYHAQLCKMWKKELAGEFYTLYKEAIYITSSRIITVLQKQEESIQHVQKIIAYIHYALSYQSIYNFSNKWELPFIAINPTELMSLEKKYSKKLEEYAQNINSETAYFNQGNYQNSNISSSNFINKRYQIYTPKSQPDQKRHKKDDTNN